MKTNINLKIVIIFFILGIVLILGIGTSCILMLNQIEELGTTQENFVLVENVRNQLLQTKIIIIIAISVYTVISILIGFFVLKAVVSPMKRLIKSAEKIASGENVNVKETLQNSGEVADLENAFGIMTNELNQKLSEVNRQKRQIETILLYMTDGIIAFDMDGKVIHINPAANKKS